MHLKPYLAPTNVSFYKVQCMEVGRDATEVEGYFAQFAAGSLSHVGPGAGKGDVWFQIECDNSWDPSWDNAVSAAYSAPWSDGRFTWVIPGKWKVGAGPTNDLANGWDQVFTIDSAGTVTVSKFRHTVTRRTNQQYGTAN